MALQTVSGSIRKCFNGGLFEGAIHAFYLPIGPRMFDFCKAMIDQILSADSIKNALKPMNMMIVIRELNASVFLASAVSFFLSWLGSSLFLSPLLFSYFFILLFFDYILLLFINFIVCAFRAFLLFYFCARVFCMIFCVIFAPWDTAPPLSPPLMEMVIIIKRSIFYN